LDFEKTEADVSFMTSNKLIEETFPVVASSPMPSRYEWGKQRVDVPIVSMPLWERDELKKG
jgi:hypothetical protein